MVATLAPAERVMVVQSEETTATIVQPRQNTSALLSLGMDQEFSRNAAREAGAAARPKAGRRQCFESPAIRDGSIRIERRNPIS
jgi:hypothetical protein